jgi:anti-anti-sigma factor
VFEAQVEPGPDGVVVVRVAGEIDIAVEALLEHVLCRAADGDGARHVLVDLTGVEFLDSGGVQALVRGYQAATGVGAAFTIRNAASIVVRVLRITGVAATFGLDGPDGVGTARADGAGWHADRDG